VRSSWYLLSRTLGDIPKRHSSTPTCRNTLRRAGMPALLKRTSACRHVFTPVALLHILRRAEPSCRRHSLWRRTAEAYHLLLKLRSITLIAYSAEAAASTAKARHPIALQAGFLRSFRSRRRVNNAANSHTRRYNT